MTHRRAGRALIPVFLVLVFAACLNPVAAQGTTYSSSSPTGGDLRFFQQFFTDPAITSQWWEAQLRIQRGNVPPVPAESDGFQLGPVIALRPYPDWEIGGQVFFVDYELDRPERVITPGGSRSFRSESGAGDLEIFGKRAFRFNDTHFAVGASVALPTGSEDDGLGTGEVVPAIFGAVRRDVGDFIGTAHLGFRLNRDATIRDRRFNGETSTFLGAGFLIDIAQDLYWSVEATVESERFDRLHTDIRLTGGVTWSLSSNSRLRGAVGVGLADASPDIELIGGYVYTF